MARTIRWGILSTARISHQFARDFAHAEGGALVAVASRSLDKAQAFAAQHGIARAYGGYQDLLADRDIDAVYVATPHTLHLPNSLDAVAAGKAVLCEKPLTVSLDEAERLISAADAAGVYLMEAMWTWLLPALRTAQAWVEQGRIGRLLHVKADFGYPMPYDPQSRVWARELGGGCLLDMGIYPVALAWRFIPRLPEACRAEAWFAPNGADSDVQFGFDYGDCRASLGTSFRCKLPNTAWLIGDRGHIEIPQFWRARECSLYERDERIDHFDDGRKGGGFEFEIAAVNRDLQAGRTRPSAVRWADSLAFQALIERVRERWGQSQVPE